MNFFESQQRARSNTTLLVVLFALAVLCLIVLTNILVAATFGYFDPDKFVSLTATAAWQNAFEWDTFILTGIGVVSVVSLASLYKMVSLAGGGERIAEMMDAERVVYDSGDINKQKILNVVEEMAISSGSPVPAVYLIDEPGINAFAAGYKPGDAIIGITRGAIDTLSRDQLQGVIAHEFSHIFNGDMRLNIRLISVLHGILIIGIIGYYITRSFRHGRVRSSKGSSSGLIFLGLGLVAIGYGGTFFGNLIKAAVSRQREYLADASAVQFTRNPDGIAGALKRIGGHSTGSKLENPRATEISHAFFGQAVNPFFTALFATHPPLEKRIRTIQPGWDGKFDFSSEQDKRTAEAPAKEDTSRKDKLTGIITTAAILESIGQPQPRHVQQAKTLLANLPATFKKSAHEPHGARAVIYTLLISDHQQTRAKQLAHLKSHADIGVYNEVENLLESSPAIEITMRLPLIDMSLPALRQLSDKQYTLFKSNLDALIKMDAKISLFEWALQKILRHHLSPRFEHMRSQDAHLYLTQTRAECELVISFLVHACKQEGLSPEQVFALSQKTLGLNGLKLRERATLELEALDTAIDRLNLLKPLQKPALIKACATAISADQIITASEHELLRAIADGLDCPMPPLVV